MGDKEERKGTASYARPIYATDIVEIGTAEVERSAIEKEGGTRVVNLPQASAITFVLTEVKEFTMLIDVAEFQYAV